MSKDLDRLTELLSAAHHRMDMLGYPHASRPRGWHEFRTNTKTHRSHPRIKLATAPAPMMPERSLVPGDWADDAACKGQMDLMFPVDDGRQWRAQQHQAISLCMTCPVLPECRQWALADPDPAFDGIAGGMTAKQRHQWRLLR